jgi:hypothetical protein
LGIEQFLGTITAQPLFQLLQMERRVKSASGT